MTVYAKWKAKNSSIKYYCDDTGVVSYTQTGQVGNIVTVIDNNQCNRPNDSVVWLCNGQTYNPSSNITITSSDILCYSQWTENEEQIYNIYYKNTDDTNVEFTSDVKRTFTKSDSFDLPTNAVKDGYEFVGWYKDSSLRYVTY